VGSQKPEIDLYWFPSTVKLELGTAQPQLAPQVSMIVLFIIPLSLHIVILFSNCHQLVAINVENADKSHFSGNLFLQYKLDFKGGSFDVKQRGDCH
jgi:hypothetical protein